MLSNKKVLVLGLAKSGSAAVRLLMKLHASITINIDQPIETIEECATYKQYGIEIIAGGHPLELFEQDFDFVIKNPGIPYHKPFVLRLQQRNIPIYTEIEFGYQVAKKQKYIAVTGTNGKTTTVSLVYSILQAQYSTVHLAGNIGRPLCDVILEANLLEEQDHYIILEMSNFQLLHIDTFTPMVSTITNLSPDHLDYMESLDAYYASKMRIYKNQTTTPFVCNLDDATMQNYIQKYPLDCPVITFSMKQKADCYIGKDHIIYQEEEIIGLQDIVVIGDHNLQNIMIAICIAKACHVPTRIINQQICCFTGVEHRLEFVGDMSGVRIYNDSKATNVEATCTALAAFRQPVILLLGGYDKGLDITAIKQYRDIIRYIITFGQAGSRFLKDLQLDQSMYVTDLKTATIKALDLAAVGDAIVLSPATSSYDAFTNYEERGKAFKEYVQMYIKKNR